MKRVGRAVFSLLIVTGCVAGLEEDPECLYEKQEEGNCETVRVQFDVGCGKTLKSSVSPDEDQVEDLNLYAFCEGKLVAEAYFAGNEQHQLKLLIGHRYNLYVLANMGPVDADVSEEEFRENCCFRIASVDELGELLPMAWSRENVIVTDPSVRISVMLERLIAKVLFSVDKAALNGLGINSVRIRQCPLVVQPFTHQTGSRIDSDTLVADGDYASVNDLAEVNEGGQIAFYVLENCQGQLLNGNTDPWAKVPENIPDRAGVCTYLEVDCSFKPGYFYSGNVVYRLYLGRDNVSDFNIRRNNILIANLFLTNQALGKVSWRVDAEVSVNDGYAQGWLSRGLHSVDDLYVGERFEYTLLLADEVLEHVRRNPENLRLCMDDSGYETSEAIVQFGELVPDGSESGDGPGEDGNFWRFKVSGLCRRHGSATIQLRDEAGKLLAELDDLIVQKPRLMLSEYSSASSVVPGLSGPPQYLINGDTQELFVYLVDSSRRNLNTSSGCGFDLSLFDVKSSCDGLTGRADGTISVDLSDGAEGDDGPVCRCSVMVSNDGSSEDVSRDLLDFMSSGDFAYLVFNEKNFNLAYSQEFMLDYLPVTLTLVDNGWAGYDDCQISMMVENPSNLPLQIHCWQLNRANDRYNAINRNEIVDLYGKEFSRVRKNYLCGDYSPGLMPLYCSGSYVETCTGGIYSLPEISTSAIYNVLQYDYFGQEALYHQIDAMFADGTRVYKLDTENNLQDGSMEYIYVYGTEGWNDKGIILYTGGYRLSSPTTDLDSVKGVHPLSLYRMSRNQTEQVSIVYNAGNQSFCASVNSAELIGMELNAEFEVEAEGYVQTTPNGTWGKKIDNYCSARVLKEVKNIVLGTTFTMIDGNAVKDAMDLIYAHTYADSYNKVGSSKYYDHSAHPTSLKVSLRCSLAGKYSDQMMPVTVTSSSSVTFEHVQEGVTYSVPMQTEFVVNSVGFVENLKR